MRLAGRRSKPDSRGEGRRLPSFLFRPVRFRGSQLTIIDQRALPGRVVRLKLRSAREVAQAIRTLAVRGAPLIGVAAAYGLAVEAKRLPDARLRPGLERAARMLGEARPTAVNLKRAVDRVAALLEGPGLSAKELRQAVVREARVIDSDEEANSLAIARHGAGLLRTGARVLTICNTGALAAPGMGTALGVVFEAFRRGKRPKVFACETRPLLQGARLTASELVRAGINATLIADSAAATVINDADVVLVGADRVARNGDAANKVGTLMLAVLAKRSAKPFYVCAPVSTFDAKTRTGEDIVVEERDGDEVRLVKGRRIAPQGVAVFNPAFDVTPARLVAGFVTDRGIIRPPFLRSIREMLRKG